MASWAFWMDPPVVTMSSTRSTRQPSPTFAPSTSLLVPRPLGSLRTTNHSVPARTEITWANWSAPMVRPPTASNSTSPKFSRIASHATFRSAPRERAALASMKSRLSSPDASTTGSGRCSRPRSRTISMICWRWVFAGPDVLTAPSVGTPPAPVDGFSWSAAPDRAPPPSTRQHQDPAREDECAGCGHQAVDVLTGECEWRLAERLTEHLRRDRRRGGRRWDRHREARPTRLAVLLAAHVASARVLGVVADQGAGRRTDGHAPGEVELTGQDGVVGKVELGVVDDGVKALDGGCRSWRR